MCSWYDRGSGTTCTCSSLQILQGHHSSHDVRQIIIVKMLKRYGAHKEFLESSEVDCKVKD